jgi:hypothetical protein
MAILEPTKLETANYGTVGWNAIYSSNFQKINDYLKKFNWSITTITYSASITVDWNASDVQIVTLTGNATINFSNPRSGGKYVLLVKQDGTGGRTITWGSNIVCGLQPKSTANSITAFFFIYDSTNSKYICVQQEAFNADTLDGQHGSYYLDRTNHTGTQPPSTISPQGRGSGLNADRVDDFDASQTPAPNTIPVAKADGKLDSGWLPSSGWTEDAENNKVYVINTGRNVGIGTTVPSAKLHVIGDTIINGAFSTKVNTITANTTLDNTYHIVLADASSNAITITLPSASTCSGRQYIIKKIDSSENAVTITPQSGQTIDGQTSISIIMQNDLKRIVSNGTNWYII